MPSYSQVHAWMEAQVGVTESGGPDGRSGNIVRYWHDIGMDYDQGFSWCGAFQDAGAKATGLKLPGSMVSTREGAHAFDRAGRFIRDPNGGQPGDMTFYGWNGGKNIDAIDHIEWLLAPQPNAMNVEIGGNTSNVGDFGPAQRNGGCVAKRIRDRRFVVGYGRPTYTRTKAPVPVVKHNPFNHHDSLVKWTQWALGVPIDGVPGPQTWTALRLFQQRHNIIAPHYPDSATIAALSVITHTS